MKNSGIYKIQSIIKPDCFYIGSAIHLKQRWNTHLYYLRKNKHHSPILQNHYNKYGESDLIFIIIEPCFPEFLIVREQHHLDISKPFFNISMKAGSLLGFKFSDETKNKHREKMKGNKHSLGYKHPGEFKQGCRNRMIGNQYAKGAIHSSESDEQRSNSMKLKKIIPWNKGIKIGSPSEEARQKMRDRAKERPPMSEEQKSKISLKLLGNTHAKGKKGKTYKKHIA